MRWSGGVEHSLVTYTTRGQPHIPPPPASPAPLRPAVNSVTTQTPVTSSRATDLLPVRTYAEVAIEASGPSQPPRQVIPSQGTAEKQKRERKSTISLQTEASGERREYVIGA